MVELKSFETQGRILAEESRGVARAKGLEEEDDAHI
jgi:hypothetical protein